MRWAAGELAARREAKMLERLGNVLYWLGCGLAGILFIAGILVIILEMTPSNDPYKVWLGLAICWGLALIAWLIGRACRYILSGK
jgi:hypothetical protein